MKKAISGILSVAAIVVLFVSCVTMSPDLVPTPEDALLREVKQEPIVKLRISRMGYTSGNFSSSYCSGVMISPHVGLTAAHCFVGKDSIATALVSDGTSMPQLTSIEYDRDIKITFFAIEPCYCNYSAVSDASNLRPEKLNINGSCDLAYFFIEDDTPLSYYKVDELKRKPSTLQFVNAGYPGGGDYEEHAGVLVNIRHKTYLSSAKSIKGMSGGPFMRKDTVYGIITGYYKEGISEFRYYGVRIDKERLGIAKGIIEIHNEALNDKRKGKGEQIRTGPSEIIHNFHWPQVGQDIQIGRR